MNGRNTSTDAHERAQNLRFVKRPVRVRVRVRGQGQGQGSGVRGSGAKVGARVGVRVGVRVMVRWQG